jgi:hypothetical protein
MIGSGRCSFLGSLALVLAICLCLSACGGSKVTSENFAKIKPKMTESEVKDILGSPTETKEENTPSGKTQLSIWKSGNNVVTIGFIEGKVVSMDGKFAGN